MKSLTLAKRLAKKLLRPLRSPWLTKTRIVSDLNALGVVPGQVLLVHSSLSALGFVPGGAGTVITALRDVVGPEGTLVLPAHSWAEMEEGGREFNVRTTRVCIGAIAEEFRQMPGVIRSLHPTHSVAASGPLAEWITAGHDLCATPCGDGSPYAKLLEKDGQILFLGIGLESNTAFHTAEAQAELPYLLQDRPDEFTLVDASGHRRQAAILRHRPAIRRRFREMKDVLVREKIVREGWVGSAPCLLLQGARFAEFMRNALQENPNLLLADESIHRETCPGGKQHE